ncbi:hypothetical protein J14TS2_07770 [Bacillus sp. J14TS2]|uniref:hypothetical protein n=1 Tax=Bacillus sp. J14TS2 TaxID=2807188 RepID=UPI001B2E4FF8|nr:hypothetical protein [Bacillus sp. J14TS2]GIN70302.1 hypothetical protein J14TS2_07770 [Bacillus sp. J14TS2]
MNVQMEIYLKDKKPSISILYILADNNESGKITFRQSAKEELFSDVDNDAIVRSLDDLIKSTNNYRSHSLIEKGWLL